MIRHRRGSSLLPLPLPRLAASAPDRLAVRFAGTDTDYRNLSARADDLARRLTGLEVGAGDRIAVQLANSVDHVALIHAIARLQAVLVALHPRLTPSETAWQVARSRPRVVVIDGPGIAAEEDAPRTMTLAELEAIPPQPVKLADRVALASPQAIVFTSGTTGRPKGVVLTWGNQLAAASASALRIGALPDDRWLAPLPLCHVGGLAVVLRCALAGAAILLHDRFDAAAVDLALDDEGATVASLVPTMLARVIEARGERPAPAALRAVLLGGGPASPDLLRRARALGFPLAPTYGLTEAASQVATAFPGDFDDERPAAPPLPLVDVRVVGDDGRAVPVGAEGEVLVRGLSVMAGYWDEPEVTARALRGGWLHTGDVGSLDAAGRLSIAARRDDLIVTGGENVYPAEVERALEAHPDVLAACVVGIPDPTWGQRVAAVVELRAGSTATAPELEAHVRRSLAGFKVPRRWQVMGEGGLPRTASGKVRRGDVGAWFEGAR